MTPNPFLITGPAVISFSGGRTSALMLYLILLANGGRLPPGVIVVFANTGKEREETLRFVHEVETRWGIRIYWVEWRATSKQAQGRALGAWLAKNDPDRRMVNDAGFERVGYNSASRNGEPFEALIAMKSRLPNWKERWCTEFLKVKTMTALVESYGRLQGDYYEVIGLRKDEEPRVLRSMENAQFKWVKVDGKRVQVPRDPPRRTVYPLYTARISKEMVRAFWKWMPFDLGLEPHEGNCDFFFMKGKKLRKRIARDRPDIPVWWNRLEVDGNQFWDRRDKVAQILIEVRNSPEIFEEPDDEEFDAACGDGCGVSA